MSKRLKLGIIGGGQLALMALPTLHRYQIDTFILADSEDPCAQVDARCYIGSPTNYQDVLSFGKKCTHITVEIENVNIEALEELEHLGIDVCPRTEVLKLIRDKKKQKDFFIKENFPCAPFAKEKYFPVIQKLCVGGYDGKGVRLQESAVALAKKSLPGECFLEEKINIKKELSIIVARNRAGEMTQLPVVEMVFNKKLNLLDYLFSPADISALTLNKMQQIAADIANKIKLEGILAIEFFETIEGEIMINEIAPRPHNSGHHTLEANSLSQFELWIRAVLNWPLPQSITKSPAFCANILGQNKTGETLIRGFENLLLEPSISLHLYHKKISHPGRKMGHVTILKADRESALKDLKRIRSCLVIEGS